MLNVLRCGLLLSMAILSPFVLFAAPQMGRPAQMDRPEGLQSGAGCGGNSPVASPDRQHSAYISCKGAEQGVREITLTVLDAAGKPISTQSARVKRSCTPEMPTWLDDHRVGVICRTDPEVSTYLVFNVQAGSEASYPGYSFNWSPDGKTLADVKRDVMFGTPAGENSCLFLNGEAVYPSGCDHARESYSHIHTFLSPLVWSPDSGKVAFVEKIFDWEYTDPFIRYFDGEASNVQYYLVIVSGHMAEGYRLSPGAAQQVPVWQTNSQIMLGSQAFDLESHPPVRIP